jgi:hypothetical protein
MTPKWREIDRHSYASQNQIPNLGRGNESALAFYCFSFLSWKRFKISSCGNYYLSLLILGATFMKVHQNQYSDDYNSDLIHLSTPLHASLCIGDQLHFAIIFQSLPSSLSDIMMVWERKKEKKKLAVDMNAMLLVVVCCDGIDSAQIQYRKDMERNTEHVQHHGK